MQISINGRFLSQPVTGIQRFGREVVAALDKLIARGTLSPLQPVRIFVPRGAYEVPSYSALRVEVGGRLSGQAWEQLELPALARDTFLLNLCQIGPALKVRQLVVMHDASTYAVPWAFSWPFRTWYRILMPTLARCSQQVVTVSEFSKAELSRYCGLDPERLPVVYEAGEHILCQPADGSALSRRQLTPGNYVLAVSSLNPSKNFQGLARAFHELASPHFDIVVAGGANSRVFRGALALPPSIKYIGYASDQELRALYESAGCFVFPSIYEGFGLPPLEAMTCGCPVLASKAASIPEICGEAAMYFDPHSPRDMAEKIKTLMSDPGLQAELRVKGKGRAASFTWEACAKALWSLATARG